MEAELEQTIHPEALKISRKRRGWTQKDLAEKCLCSSEQVSRWERGKSRRVRSYLRERLTKALGVSWEALTRPPDRDKALAAVDDASGLVQLNVRVKRSERNALQLVCLRYNLRPADVIRLAPLLFLIIAEKSLVHRQANLEAIVERNYQTEKQNNADAPHLSLDIPPETESVDDLLSSEQHSIKNRDLFGFLVGLGNVDYDTEATIDPFVNYLEVLMADVPSDLVDMIHRSWEENIDYQVAVETLREVTGIAGETDAEQKILNAILEGDIDLGAVLSEKKTRSQEEYLSWLQMTVEAANSRSLASKREEFLLSEMTEVNLSAAGVSL